MTNTSDAPFGSLPDPLAWAADRQRGQAVLREDPIDSVITCGSSPNARKIRLARIDDVLANREHTGTSPKKEGPVAYLTGPLNRTAISPNGSRANQSPSRSGVLDRLALHPALVQSPQVRQLEPRE